MHSSALRTAFEVTSPRENEKPILHAQCKILYDSSGSLKYPDSLNISAICDRLHKKLKRDDIYTMFNQIGLQYGPNFQMIDSLVHNDVEVISRIQLPQQLENSLEQFYLHPNILDGAIQSVFMLLADSVGDHALYLPFSMGQLIFSRHAQSVQCMGH